MADPKPKTAKHSRRDKLGLALAGGGFRASLFHLGVLRRMAELDLLRSVEVLSTVSGGSIIGAMYMLLLKEGIERSGNLSRDQYIALIDELQQCLIHGIRKNLRTRLFMNPFGLLRVLTTSDSLGRRMSRIYERYLYRKIADRLQPKQWWEKLIRPGRIALRNTMIKLPDSPIEKMGIAYYNIKATGSKQSVITNFIMNATSLNSGAAFRFSASELGDGRLGFFRHDELEELEKRKRLLFSLSLAELKTYLESSSGDPIPIEDNEYKRAVVSLAYWWRAGKMPDVDTLPPAPAEWKALFELDGFPGRMLNEEFGLLRRVKVAAWYLRIGMKKDPPLDGGLSASEHTERFWNGFERIYPEQAGDLKKEITKRDLYDLLLDFTLEFYYLRTAEVMSTAIRKDWDRLTLATAVGASACFPPVFPPFIMLGFYDDAHVSRLGLSDGGVYDNVGIGTLIDERCNYIIASDTGGLFRQIQQSTTGRVGMIGRIVSILMDDVAHNQRENLRARRDAAKRVEELDKELLESEDLLGLAFFHINSPKISVAKGLDLNLDSKVLASIRTDLDGFGDIEIAALVDHGYDTADRYLRTYLAESPYAKSGYWASPPNMPLPLDPESGCVKEVLRAGAGRFLRAVKLRAPISIVFLIAVFVGVVYTTWTTSVSVHAIVDFISKLSLGWIQSTAGFLGEAWTGKNWSVGRSILAAGIAALAIAQLKKLINRLKNIFPRCYSRGSTIGKWVKSLWQNLVWVSGLWPLAIIFGWSLLAWVSHVFFYLPFEQKAKNRS